jgi:Rrf2 family iron-sulfur cluster assembly transcriptional regulator
MIFSKTSEYAVRSLIYFAVHPKKDRATVKAVSRSTGVPQAYVAKIFQCLSQCGILLSQRGPRGGYALAVPASELPLLRVVQSVDDMSKSSFSNCLMGLEKCQDLNPCPLHEVWKKAKEEMLEQLGDSTIADVAKLGRKFRNGKHRRSILSKGMRNVFTV